MIAASDRGPIACPGCGQPMRSLALERVPLGTERVDLCGGCQAIWFDAFESVQLTPGATLELFRAIRADDRAAPAPLPSLMRCPRCTEPLQLTHDLQRTTRFTYHRCPYGHGRFTPFFQFLREKNFVRPLDPQELARLKQAVRIVRCSSCGAPIDLATMTSCAYCHAPIAILDPDAVAKTVAELQAAKPKPTSVDVDALALQFSIDQRADEARRRASGETGYVFDLMGACLDALFIACER